MSDCVEWSHMGANYRIDKGFIHAVEHAVTDALNEAEEREVDLLDIGYDGCEACIVRVVVAVAMAQAVEGMKTGLLERV